MNTSDLRIGNYIQLITTNNNVNLPSGFVKKVSGISNFELNLSFFDVPDTEQESEKTHINDVCALPLNEYYLRKFGFIEEINSSMVKYWKKDYFTIYHEYYLHTAIDNLEWFFLSSSEYGMNVRIKSVHELQNLFKNICFSELNLD